ncbi:MAG: SurA N-terminal domain-containing protein [Alistipes sp.]|nr:SurA N-terminal domain-containing protein [Alistipes sp.]
MATLNTLRTKFGIVLSIVIALALLAFILSLKTEMGFSGNNPKVGEIAGDKITYSEFYDEYELTKMQNGGNDVYDEASEERINAAAWQSLIARHAVLPGFERLGLTVTDAERIGMLSGEHLSGVYYSFFADPATGEYDVAALADFLAAADNNPQLGQTWKYINSQAVLEREITKFLGLVRGGAYVNSLEVADGVRNANRTFSGKVAYKSYASVPDSLFKVSTSEAKRYYKEHKNLYKQQPSRTINYVVFDVDPTAEDMEALESTVYARADEFAVADDVKSFVRQNRGTVENNFVSRAQLSTAEAEALMAGKMYGPVLENDVWKMARVVESRNVPDSIGLRHVVLSYSEEALADSLMTVLKNGGDFARIAADYSIAQTAVAGGELGVMPFSALPKEFADELSAAKKGDKVKVVSGNVIQLIDVYRADKPSKHINVARIEYPVEASSATKRAVHNAASSFAVNAKGSVANFSAAADNAAVTTRTAAIYNGERSVRGLDKSHEIVRWAYGADKGDVSEIFNVGKDYVVAILTDIDNNEYRSLKSVQNEVYNAVMRDKKYEYIAASAEGADVEAVAESFGTAVTEFDNLSNSAYYIPQVGFEPRLVGAVTATEEIGALSAPVKGSSGVYLFTVEDIADSEAQTAEAEQVRRQSAAEGMAQQAAMFALQELAKVKDLRSRYF